MSQINEGENNSNNTTITTVVYVVTFRMNKDQPQQELVRYTRPAAEIFAQGILDSGGVAIVTEDVRTLEEPLEHAKRSLAWD